MSVSLDSCLFSRESQFEKEAQFSITESVSRVEEIWKKIQDLGSKLASGPSFLRRSFQDFTHIAAKAIPATVLICALEGYATLYDPTSSGVRNAVCEKKAKPQFHLGQGSGFLISPDGDIVTNYHVIRGASRVVVIFNASGSQYLASVRGVDPETDLALLKIEETELPYLEFGDSDKLKVGELVVATGNPYGLEDTLTVGVVSGKGRQNMGLAAYDDYIQTDASINQGNSGGPLLNPEGEVMGVNAATIEAAGIGFSIPSNLARQVISQLKETGSVKRAYFGADFQPIDSLLAEALGLNEIAGMVVFEVLRGSPAADAGLQNGDIILRYNDCPVTTIRQFRRDLALEMSPGEEIKISILRSGEPMDLKVVLGSESRGEGICTEEMEKLGIYVDDLQAERGHELGYDANTEGVLISKVRLGSPADESGLRPSFIITGVAIDLTHHIPVRNVEEFNEALKEIGDKKHVILIVRDKNSRFYKTVKVE